MNYPCAVWAVAPPIADLTPYQLDGRNADKTDRAKKRSIAIVLRRTRQRSAVTVDSQYLYNRLRALPSDLPKR